jgi:two-component system phosphate regulon response regulator PhoB
MMVDMCQHDFQGSLHHSSRLPAIRGITLHPQDYRASVNGIPVELGPTLFKLLRLLMNHRGRLLTRTQLLDNVWGRNVYIEGRTLDMHITRLRKVLEPFNKADLIETVSGAGYRFSAHKLLESGEGSQ